MNHDLTLISCASIVIGVILALLSRLVKMSPRFEKIEPFISLPLIILGGVVAIILVIFKPFPNSQFTWLVPYPVYPNGGSSNPEKKIIVPIVDLYTGAYGSIRKAPVERLDDTTILCNYSLVVLNAGAMITHVEFKADRLLMKNGFFKKVSLPPLKTSNDDIFTSELSRYGSNWFRKFIQPNDTNFIKISAKYVEYYSKTKRTKTKTFMLLNESLVDVPPQLVSTVTKQFNK